MTKEEWIKIYNAKDGTWDKDYLIDKAYEIITSPIRTNYDLTNRQKADIEKRNKKANTPFAKVTFDENKLKEIVSDVAKNIEFNLNSVKSEAIKEFAEELKNCFAISGDYLDIINIIDNLVKEMTEVKK